MTVTLPSTKYPVALTNAAWQKKKSFLDKAKSKTKTGLGEKLTLAEAAWGKINFDLLVASKQVIPTADAADKAKKAAVAHRTTVVGAASKALSVAAVTAAKTKANAALSPTAKQAAATLEAGLLTQMRLLRDDIDLSDFDLAKQHIIDLTGATSFQMIKSGLVKAQEFHSLVEKDPTRDNFNDHIQAVCRRLTVPLGTIGAYKGKEDPKALVTPLARWADGKDKLPAYKDAQEEKTEVRKALETFEDAIVGVQHWAA